MPEHIQADLCIIGAGAAGLAVANSASQLGAETILIEEQKELGGSSFHHNCIPSKSLISSSKIAQLIKRSESYGINIQKFNIDFKDISSHMQRVKQEVGLSYAAERFEGMGVKIIRGHAEFISQTELKVDDKIIEARRFVIATGSKPAIPPYPGLTDIDYLTNETIFMQETLPKHLIILGGEPFAIEIAQAFARLGSKVTILEIFTMLDQYDPEIVNILRKRFLHENIEIKEKIHIRDIKKDGNQIAVTIQHDNQEEKITGSTLYLAAGRIPHYDHLNLAAAEVEGNVKGIMVDDRLRTTNKRIFAVGDVIGHAPYSHCAQLQASVVIKNALFMWPAKVDYSALSRVTFTDPEIAQVGVMEKELLLQNTKFRTLRWSYGENNRAILDHLSSGIIKVTITPSGRILGASIIGAHAGEIIMPWAMAIKNKMKISAIADVIAPYPTYSVINNEAANIFYLAKILSGRLRKVVNFIQKYF